MHAILRLSSLLTIPLALVLSTSSTASAQEVTRMPDGTRHSIGVDTGLESAFIARATYAHRVGDLGFLKDARLYGRLTLPFVAPDLGDWGVDGGMRATPLALGDLRLSLLVGPVVRRSDNELFSATAVGVGATMLVGYEGPRWGLSVEAGYQQMLATHLSHSDVVRETSYAGAKDGWYALSGSTANAGLRGGARFGSVEVFARAGANATGQLHAVMPPFYFTLGGAYVF